MKTLKRLSLILVICLLTSLTGCWNYREIESLAIVSAIAIDRGENGAKYHLTFQYVSPPSGSKDSSKPVLIETQGDTVFDAVRNAIKQSKNKLFFSDCKILIISREVAADGINAVLDWFNRDAETRITIDLLVSTQGNAGTVLEQDPNATEISGYTINSMIETGIKGLGKNPDVAIYQANSILSGKGIDLALPSIDIIESGTRKTPQIQGTAVFKGDTLQGFLDDMESRYLLAATGKLKGGLLLTNVNSDEDNVALEINSSETSCTAVVEDGVPRIQLEIKTVANLAEENSEGSNVSESGLAEVESAAAETMRSGVIRLVQKMQKEYGSDIFGFGSAFYQSNPDYWKQNGDEWDEIFKTLKVDVSAKVKIPNTAIANPKK